MFRHIASHKASLGFLKPKGSQKDHFQISDRCVRNVGKRMNLKIYSNDILLKKREKSTTLDEMIRKAFILLTL